MRWLVATIAAVLLAGAVIFLSLCFGGMEISAARIPGILFHGGNDTAARVVLELRLPRRLAAFANSRSMCNVSSQSGSDLEHW